ncbi:MAG: class I SAM-dependent methyltransferase [Ignavibacteriales bacterium]|jgi:SAM-dependent methyltransferase|nr:class I SAM-dependent methyltransferase [Ignavibacteriales bacterium]HOJ18437.1 class I SAM-dependent methyltransferase [Ignavibacteriaceae bacterium]
MLEKFIEKQYFEPGISGILVNPFYISRKNLFTAIKSFGKAITGKTLDVGCGTKPYEHLFSSSEYVGLEIETTINREMKKADVFYDGTTFPFPDGEFDSVVTNQVLEHVFNPEFFMSEINRVMKKDGKLLLTVPFVWDEHEQPYDYARYSSFGLTSILKNAGFEITELKKTANDFRVIYQLTNAYFYKVTRNIPGLKQFTTLFICSIITLIGLLVGKIFPKNDDLFLDIVVLAKKVDNV